MEGAFYQPSFWHLGAVQGPSTPSFDDLVGAGEQRRRHLEAERPGGWQVDDQLELGGLGHRQLRWLLASAIIRGAARAMGEGRAAREADHRR